MATLNERLDRIREGFRKEAPPEVLAAMGRAHQQLVDSRIMDGIPRVGDKFPGFELPDSEGNLVSSAALLASGPLVVTFYRGVW